MFSEVIAHRFYRPADNGKTKPCWFACHANDGKEVEVLVKFSAGCEQGVSSLAIEAISAFLAADLGLPVPEPLRVHVDPRFASLIEGHPDIRRLIADSCMPAFGSTKLPTGFHAWTPSYHFGDEAIPDMTSAFCFDALIDNPDRRPNNPNCLVNGSKFAIFDHELSFRQNLILFWKPPWEMGGLQAFSAPDKHIFYLSLRSGRFCDTLVFARRWGSITDERIGEYATALPVAWLPQGVQVQHALEHIRRVRDNADAWVDEVGRILG